MNIIPLQNYVLLEEVKDDPQSKTGIFIPDDANTESTRKAKIVKLGEKVTLPIKKGDIVLFKPYGFDEITFGIIDKQKFLLGREENIHAILKFL